MWGRAIVPRSPPGDFAGPGRAAAGPRLSRAGGDISVTVSYEHALDRAMLGSDLSIGDWWCDRVQNGEGLGGGPGLKSGLGACGHEPPDPAGDHGPLKWTGDEGAVLGGSLG